MRGDPSGRGNNHVSGTAAEPCDPPDLRITLLGDFQVSVGDRVIPDSAWGRRKARSLVKLLALTPRHRLHREEVIESLWPNHDPGAAGVNLRVTLHAARRALDASGDDRQRFLTFSDEELALQPEGRPWVDALAFEQAASAALQSGALDDFQAALALYGGELLPGDRFEDWSAGHRERLHNRHVTLLIGFAEALRASGNVPASLDALERVITEDPTNEEAAARLMAAYARSGQRHRALRLFRTLRDALLEELDAVPDDETKRVYAEILSGVAIREQSAADQQHIPPTNLPAPLTSFVGREREVAQVTADLAMSRLVTLTGVGGCGKTRLAIAVARRLVDQFPGGAWFVDLSPLGSGEGIPAAIVAALRLHLDLTLDERAALVDALRAREALLVFDNCEHLIEPCAALVDELLQSCPQLRVLATSREPLRIPGEVSLRVPPLDVPPEQDLTLAEIAPQPAVQLFHERARHAQPEFELTASNAPVIAEICRRLDGLPLAIELAAARVSLFPVEQLATLLHDPLRLLTGGARTADPRQQTLRATLAWSYGLLDDAERRLLARLSVFAGGWTLEAAEVVCGEEGVARGDVLSLLAQLVDKSLVEARAAETEARYRLLETIRQFASEQLAASGETAAFRRRHALYFLDLAETAHPELTGERQTDWLERLEQEHDDLRAALRWAVAQGEVEVEARLCAALWRFWYFHGHLAEAARWLSAARERAEASTLGARLRGQLLQGAGVVDWNRGDIEQAADLNHQALALFTEAGDLSLMSATQHNLGIIADWRMDYAEATRWYEASLRIREALEDKLGIATSLHALGNVAREQRDLERASALQERSLALLRKIGNPRGIAFALSASGVVALDRADYARAEAFSTESLELFRELGDRSQCAFCLNNIGYAVTLQGNAGRAVELQAECLRLASEVGDGRATAYALEGLATAIAAPGSSASDARQAARLYGAAEAHRESLGLPLPLADRALNERSLSAARDTLGAAAFTAAWNSGRALSLDEAVADALAAAASCASTEQGQQADAAATPLSPREREVVELLAGGLTNRQIAAQLGVARRTVDAHVSNILRKLGVSSRREIAAWAGRDSVA